MRKLLILTVIMDFILAFFQVASAKSTLDEVKERGKLIAGVRFDAPPFGYINKENQSAGFDVELVKAFAKRLNVGIELKQVTAKTRIPMLTNASVDLVAAMFTKTREREQVIDFSITYYTTGTKLLVKKGSGIKSYRDLAGKTVAAAQGGHNVISLKKVQPAAKILSFQEYPQCVLAVKQGKAAALVSDATLLYDFAKQDPELEVVGEAFSREPYGIGVRENDSKWLKFVNHTIMELWDSGEFNQIHRKIFGRDVDYEIDWMME